MSQIFKSSPPWFFRRFAFQKTKQAADDQIHNGHALWRSTFSNTFGGWNGEATWVVCCVNIFWSRNYCASKNNPYIPKTKKEKITWHNVSCITTIIHKKGKKSFLLTRCIPAMAYILRFKNSHGLKFVLTTAIHMHNYSTNCVWWLPLSMWKGGPNDRTKMLKVVPSSVNFDRQPVNEAVSIFTYRPGNTLRHETWSSSWIYLQLQSSFWPTNPHIWHVLKLWEKKQPRIKWVNGLMALTTCKASWHAAATNAVPDPMPSDFGAHFLPWTFYGCTIATKHRQTLFTGSHKEIKSNMLQQYQPIIFSV